jgi:hypothetical protein
MLGIGILNMISLTLAIYCLFKYVWGVSSFQQSLNHRLFFRDTTIAMVFLFHLVLAALSVSDLVMAWSINTSNRVGYTTVMALNTVNTMIMEMMLVCVSGYLQNIMPAFLQGRLGPITNFILQHGPRLSLFIFSICIVVNAVTFCLLSDRPVLAFLIARLEMLLLFFMNAMYASITMGKMAKLIKSCRDSKRMDEGQVQTMQKFWTVLSAGVAFLVTLPVIQIIEACLYWDYYMGFSYDGTFSGEDLYPVHFAAPFVAILICPIFLAKEASSAVAVPTLKEAKTNLATNPTDQSHNKNNEERLNATQMVNAALKNWVETGSNLDASL